MDSNLGICNILICNPLATYIRTKLHDIYACKNKSVFLDALGYYYFCYYCIGHMLYGYI